MSAADTGAGLTACRLTACRGDGTAVDGDRSLVVSGENACTDTGGVLSAGHIDHAAIDRDIAGGIVIAADAGVTGGRFGDTPSACSRALSPYGQRTSAVDRHALGVRKGRAVAEDEIHAALRFAVVADAVVVGDVAHHHIPAAFQIGLIAENTVGGDSLLLAVQVDIGCLDGTGKPVERFCFG